MALNDFRIHLARKLTNEEVTKLEAVFSIKPVQERSKGKYCIKVPKHCGSRVHDYIRKHFKGT